MGWSHVIIPRDIAVSFWGYPKDYTWWADEHPNESPPPSVSHLIRGSVAGVLEDAGVPVEMRAHKIASRYGTEVPVTVDVPMIAERVVSADALALVESVCEQIAAQAEGRGLEQINDCLSAISAVPYPSGTYPPRGVGASVLIFEPRDAVATIQGTGPDPGGSSDDIPLGRRTRGVSVDTVIPDDPIIIDGEMEEPEGAEEEDTGTGAGTGGQGIPDPITTTTTLSDRADDEVKRNAGCAPALAGWVGAAGILAYLMQVIF